MNLYFTCISLKMEASIFWRQLWEQIGRKMEKKKLFKSQTNFVRHSDTLPAISYVVKNTSEIYTSCGISLVIQLSRYKVAFLLYHPCSSAEGSVTPCYGRWGPCFRALHISRRGSQKVQGKFTL